MPGRLKIASTITVPPRRNPSCSPTTVTSENDDGRKACPNSIRAVESPLDSAMDTKSWRNVVIMSLRNSRPNTAI